MSPATESAVVAAMQHGAMSGFDGLHDSVFDCACAQEGHVAPVPYREGGGGLLRTFRLWRLFRQRSMGLCLAWRLARLRREFGPSTTNPTGRHHER